MYFKDPLGTGRYFPSPVRQLPRGGIQPENGIGNIPRSKYTHQHCNHNGYGYQPDRNPVSSDDLSHEINFGDHHNHEPVDAVFILDRCDLHILPPGPGVEVKVLACLNPLISTMDLMDPAGHTADHFIRRFPRAQAPGGLIPGD